MSPHHHSLGLRKSSLDHPSHPLRDQLIICVMPFTVAGTLHVFTDEVSDSIALGCVNSVWKMLQFPAFWSMVGSQWPAWFVFGVLRRYVGKYWSRLLNPLRALYYAVIAAWYIKIRHNKTRVAVRQDGLCMEQTENPKWGHRAPQAAMATAIPRVPRARPGYSGSHAKIP